MTPFDTALAIDDEAEMTALPQDRAEAGTTTITTRFGTFEVDLAKTITMPQGPIGFSELSRFAILDAPDNAQSSLKLFQSMDEPSVTFIVSILSPESGLIAEDDLKAAAESHSMARENAAYFVITKIGKDLEDNPLITVNLRAPIVVDTVNLVARQAVFAGDTYDMQHRIG